MHFAQMQHQLEQATVEEQTPQDDPKPDVSGGFLHVFKMNPYHDKGGKFSSKENDADGQAGSGSGSSTADVGQPRAYLNESHRATVNDMEKYGMSTDSLDEYRALATEITAERQARNMPEDLKSSAQEMLDATKGLTSDDLDNIRSEENDIDTALSTMNQFVETAVGYFSRKSNPSVNS